MTKEAMNWNNKIGGKKAEKIPCPDGIEGCLVAHYKVIEEQTKQEQDEPFGYFRYDIRLDAWVQSRDNNKGVAFYTTPQTKEWVSLTNEQIEEIWGNTPMMLNSHNNRTRIVFAKAIEAKLKEKNHVVSGQ